MSSPKVLFIGLDAASKDLVLEWCEEGLLPNLRALQTAGSWGETANAPAVYTGSLWPSVWTGTTPGRHGCYYNEQIKPGTYEVEDNLGDRVKKEPFWNSLSRKGLRVGLFDVPKTPVSRELNGVHIVDWGTHDSDVPACSYPAELIEEMHAKHGASPFRRCDWVMDGPEPERTLLSHLRHRIDAKVAITHDLLGREAWDLFMVAFGESHCVGHQCWHIHDRTHPKHDAAMLRELGDPVRDIYVALDRAVGQVLEKAGPETTVMLLCSHGMSAHYDATYLLDEILRRLEGRPAPAQRMLLDRARRLWKRLPLTFTEQFATMARAVSRMPDSSDRRDRPCFVVPTNANSAGIRLNLAGREANGQLQPGEHADAFVARLMADLNDLVEPTSGLRLVREVIHSREVFPGEHAELLPDLFVRWNRDTPIRGARSAKIGTILQEDNSTRRTGDHRPGGLLFLRGPGIERGGRLPAVRDEDLAPTMASILGVELADVDGRALLELKS